MIGSTISHYRILEKLGEGGMGTVYKAEDLKLKRTVALKFLPRELTGEPEAKARFVREAQAAATLSHPNICTIYEIDEYEGQFFIAMECCTGETLKDKMARGPLKLEEALDLAGQIAAGLGKSHEREIVHRDIKPANCFITSEGQVKILDFGLAKLTGQTRVTRTGTTLGTAAYMSPEQAQGKATDHRSDIWSLGVVLYEMLTGRLPFPGENAPALMYAIVNEKQPPLTTLNTDIPLEVEQLVDRALAKTPEKRYQNAAEVRAALSDLQASLDLLPKRSQLHLKLLRRRRTIAASMVASALVVALAILSIRYFVLAGGKIDSIAVLPFENLSGASEDDLVEGMTLELTAALGQLSGFAKVMPYRSMKMYKGTDKTVADIAERTGVKALVAGTISEDGTLIKAIIEMIDGSSERLLWTQAFESERRNLMGMMDDIRNEILARADIYLTPAEET